MFWLVSKDGKFYVKQTDIYKYIQVFNKEEATEFSYRKAKSLLNNKKAALRWIKKRLHNDRLC